MSHHLDTPLASQNGQLYIDDLYVFQGSDSTVFVMDVNSNITGVHVKPGFHAEARYEFKVHFDGAELETLTYRVSFGEPDADGRQHLQVHALSGAEARGNSATGQLVLEGRTGEPASADEIRIWTGRIANSFYIDLSLLAIVNGAVKRNRGEPLSVAPGRRQEQLRQHDRRHDRPGSLASASPAAARRPHRALVRHETCNGRGRLAADQSCRTSHDVADLLARRHPLHKSRQHPAPI